MTYSSFFRVLVALYIVNHLNVYLVSSSSVRHLPTDSESDAAAAAAAPGPPRQLQQEPGPGPGVASAQGEIHRFNGLPHRVQFAVGDGILDCTCVQKDGDNTHRDGRSDSSIRQAQTQTPQPSDSAPYIQAPTRDSDSEAPRISPPHCYSSCQEHKCTPLYHSSGWDEWYSCIQSCIGTCYGTDFDTESGLKR
jgi:hypothetical protein